MTYSTPNSSKEEGNTLHKFTIFQHVLILFISKFCLKCIKHVTDFRHKPVSKCFWVIPASALLVLRGGAACVPWHAAAAAGRIAPVHPAVGMWSGSRLGGAAGEGDGLWLRTPGTTDLTVPEHLEEKSEKRIKMVNEILIGFEL